MPLLSKRNKPLIPPVESDGDRQYHSGTPQSTSSYHRSSAATYVPSRDDPSPAPSDNYRDKYSRSQGVGDVYSRPGADAQLDRDRSELFAGYNPQKAGSGSGRFFDGPDVAENEEEDVEAIKQQTRTVKQESVNSTRNALMLARQAEETARGTLGRLGDQSEKLANTEMHLDVAKGHSVRAGDRTDELKQLNRSIFRPVITFNKDAKRHAAEQRIQQRYEDERAEREKAMMDVRETQNRVGKAQTYGLGYDDDDDGEGLRPRKTEQQLAARKAQRSRYQFEATTSDDEVEDEIDNNLDEIEDVTKKLKMMGQAMGAELTKQNERLDTITTKTDGMDDRLFSLTSRQRKFK